MRRFRAKADDQFVELYNHSAGAIDLGGWELQGGISFKFPLGRVLPGKGYLVIARNSARLLANDTRLSAANTLGDFDGKLSGSGERIALSRPDTVVSNERSRVS